MKTKLMVLMRVTIEHDDSIGLKSAIKDLAPFQNVMSFGEGGYYQIKTGKVIKVTKVKRKQK